MGTIFFSLFAMFLCLGFGIATLTREKKPSFFGIVMASIHFSVASWMGIRFINLLIEML